MPDAQILFARTPFIEYSQILLTKSFRQYLETIMMPKVARMEIQKTPFQLARKKLPWTLRGAKDNLIGSKFRLFTTKAINILRFMTAAIPIARQE